MNALIIVRILAVGLIVLFGLGTLYLLDAFYYAGFSLRLVFALTVNIGFIIGGVGLLMIKRWSWWLTLGLCAETVIQFLWLLFAHLTAQTATELKEITTFIVVGFYLGIVFVLTSGPVRKLFRDRGAIGHTIPPPL